MENLNKNSYFQLVNTIKVLGSVASKIQSVTKVFLGLIDEINILQIFHEIGKYARR